MIMLCIKCMSSVLHIKLSIYKIILDSRISNYLVLYGCGYGYVGRRKDVDKRNVIFCSRKTKNIMES